MSISMHAMRCSAGSTAASSESLTAPVPVPNPLGPCREPDRRQGRSASFWAARFEEACQLAGSRDFGDDDGWRDGLSILLDDLVHAADLTPLGTEIAANDVVMPLRNRLQIIDWRKRHPQVVHERIERPIVIIGQPRTGTTILYDLLSQDPELRAPLTWEFETPCPPQELDTYGTGYPHNRDPGRTRHH
jgi:Sulfotransferase family